MLSIVDQNQLARILHRIWDEDEFLSPGGIRSVSRYHAAHPFTFGAGTVTYEPAEASGKIKGGNSNWRGPIWFPTSYLLIEALARHGSAHGPDFFVDAPAAHGAPIGPAGMARDLADRMIGLFTRGEDGSLVERPGRLLETGDVCVLGSDTIHAVSNPTDRITGAIHVYGGDFVNEPRSQWGPGDLVERPYDITDIERQFHQANVAAGLST